VSSSTIFAMRIKCQYRCFRHLFRRYDKVEKQNEALIEQCKLLDHRLAHVEHQLRQGSAASTLTLERGMSVIPFQGGSSPTRLSHSFRSPHGAWDRDHGENKLPMRNTGFADPSLHRSNMLSKEMLIDEGDREDNQHWDPYIYAACSGTAGGMMALFAGCASKALKQTFEGDNQFNSPWTYLFICGLGAFIFAQTHFLNRAMIEGDLMSVIPTFQAFWIVFGVVSGMAFYNNSSGMSFPGLILMIAGVLFLLQHPQVLAGVDVLGVKGCCIRIAPWCGCGGCWADQQLNDQEADGQVEFQDVENVMPPPNSSLEDIVKEDQNPVREESNEALSRPLPESPPPKLTPIAAQAEVYKGATVVPQIETIDIGAPAEP